MGWFGVSNSIESDMFTRDHEVRASNQRKMFSDYMRWKKRRFNSDGIIALNEAQSQGGMNYFNFVK